MSNLNFGNLISLTQLRGLKILKVHNCNINDNTKFSVDELKINNSLLKFCFYKNQIEKEKINFIF